jgi:hypothetical protein
MPVVVVVDQTVSHRLAVLVVAVLVAILLMLELEPQIQVVVVEEFTVLSLLVMVVQE